jgi:hypothetical protein
MVWGVEQFFNVSQPCVPVMLFYQAAKYRHLDTQKKIAFAVFTGAGFEEALQDESLRGIS